MRAIITTGSDDAKVVELAIPEVKVGHVRIAVDAAAVNPVDLQTRQGIYHRLGWIDQPDGAGLGWDIAGRIDAVGYGVDGWEVGARVVALRDEIDRPVGAYADYVVVPHDAVAAVPDELDAIAASTLPLNVLTADQALDLLGDAQGRTLLVTGAAGGVGGFALPLAQRRGWRVTALAREADRDFVVSTGVDQLVTEIFDERYDAVLDAAVLGESALAAVLDGGNYVGVNPVAVPDSKRGVSTAAVVVHRDGERLGQLVRDAAAGVLAVRIAGVGSFDQVDDVHTGVAAGGVRGRWVLDPAK